MHSPELMQLIEMKLSRPVIEYVVDYVFETVDQALARSGLRLLTAQRASYRNRFTPSSPPSSPAPPSAPPRSSSPLSTLPARAPTSPSPPPTAHPTRCGTPTGRASAAASSACATWAGSSASFLAVLDWELGVAEADLLGLPRREDMVAAAAHAVYPSVESASTLTSVEEDADHPFLRPLQRHHRRSSSAGSGPVPDLLPSSAFASPASSAGTASPPTPPTPPTPPPSVFTVTLLDVAEHPRPLTNSRKRERGRLSALLHGHWHVFHHGHRTGVGQVV
ncbi:hypothetical protein B0H14DRAFT_3429551 [Mycena olivaceomarginata]|nr:hypothetical protein B0H14DRAFT_3429551 [Mycena olivaceomarginata]